IMTGVRFLFRVTLRRHALAAEVWHIKEPQKLPPVLSSEEVKRVHETGVARAPHRGCDILGCRDSPPLKILFGGSSMFTSRYLMALATSVALATPAIAQEKSIVVTSTTSTAGFRAVQPHPSGFSRLHVFSAKKSD